MAYPTTLVGFASGEFAHVNALGNSTLVGAISSVATTIVVADASINTTWPSAWFTIRIDAEIILIQSRSGNTLTVPVGGRGYDGSTAAPHSDAARVITTFSSTAVEKLQTEVAAIENVIGLSSGYNFFNSVVNGGTSNSLIVSATVPNLSLKSLSAGSGISITPSGNNLVIATSGSAGSITAQNEGSGAQVFNTSTSTTSVFKFRSLVAGTGVSLTQNVDSITISTTGAGGSGDNLGNHSATQALNMNSFVIQNAGIISSGTNISSPNCYLNLTPSTATLNGNTSTSLMVAGATQLFINSSSITMNRPINVTQGFQNSPGMQKMTNTFNNMPANSSWSWTVNWPLTWFSASYIPITSPQTSTLSYGRIHSTWTTATTTSLTMSFTNTDTSTAYNVVFYTLGVLAT